jgi:glycosyltransferase involved in cell wall biosynthesis
MNGLFVVPAELDSLQKKGVTAGILDRDEQGFLNTAVTVHPFADRDRLVQLSERCPVYELKQPASPYRVLLWWQILVHLLRSTWLLLRLIRRHRIDFVRAHSPHYIALMSWVAARLAHLPFCISLHADYDKMHELDPIGGAPRVLGSRALARRLETVMLRRADRVLVISDYIGRYAMQRGAPGGRIRLFRHAIPLADFGKQQDGARARHRLVIGVVSRLSRQKFVYDIVSIAEKLRQRGVNFVIKIAGDGEERAGLLQRISEMDLARSIEILGFRSRGELVELHSECDVHLSLICGASLVEACAAGVCVVGYDVEWQSELIYSGKTGILVPEGDHDAAADAIERLAQDPVKRRRLGEAGRAAARTMFDPVSLRHARRSVYQELVSGKIG